MIPTLRWFLLGHTYRTLNGDRIKIVAENLMGTTFEGVEHYCVRGSDGAWRYDRPNDRGRVTGTSGQDMRNLVAGAI